MCRVAHVPTPKLMVADGLKVSIIFKTQEDIKFDLNFDHAWEDGHIAINLLHQFEKELDKFFKALAIDVCVILNGKKLLDNPFFLKRDDMEDISCKDITYKDFKDISNFDLIDFTQLYQ